MNGKKRHGKKKSKKQANGTGESQQSSHSSRVHIRLSDTTEWVACEHNNISSSQVPPLPSETPTNAETHVSSNSVIGEDSEGKKLTKVYLFMYLMPKACLFIFTSSINVRIYCIKEERSRKG